MDSNFTGNPRTYTIDQVFADNRSGFRDFTGFSFELDYLPFEQGVFPTPVNRYVGPFLDEGAAVFLVEANDDFSESRIQSGEFAELEIGTTYDFPQSFYLGIRTPNLGIGFGPPPAYGWARFEKSDNALLLLVDHAVAYECHGIVVGSLTAIPEPTTQSLGAILCLIGFGFGGRGKFRRPIEASNVDSD
ncbi:MAG: hypothetical protein AAGD11_02005 [Planctomycetota bacterium]